MKTLAEYGDFDITLFGGEPLIAPLERLDALLALGYESAGQTNGVLVNYGHIALLHRYNTSVGISIDGPDEMNDVRSAGTLEQTREATARTEAAIARLCSEGISTSIIVTLHRLNTGEALPRLKEWVKMLFLLGVESMRLHILEVDRPVVRRQYVLSDTEYLATFTDLIDFEEASGREMFDVATDLRLMLAGEDDEVTCVWAGCDPTTRPLSAVWDREETYRIAVARTRRALTGRRRTATARRGTWCLPHAAGAWRLCRMSILPHVLRPMPRHRYRRRLAESQQPLCRVEGFIHVHRIADALRGQPPPVSCPAPQGTGRPVSGADSGGPARQCGGAPHGDHVDHGASE